MILPDECAVTLAFSPSRYTGKERDTESGLDYFGARYYASSMGRFSSPDPSGLVYADQENPQSLNLYAYALNNPLKNTDPTGMYCYYGSTDADVGNDSQYDFHSSVGECTQTDENGNKGQWIDDPQTDVTVNANGDGSADSYSSSFDGTAVTPYDQHSEWQGNPDDKKLQLLSTAITADIQQETGCIAQAYGIAGVGGAAFYSGGGGGAALAKPFGGNTSVFSKVLGDNLGTFSQWAHGAFKKMPVPLGGPGTGEPFRLGTTKYLGRAVGRVLPYAGAAATAYSAYQLNHCLSERK